MKEEGCVMKTNSSVAENTLQHFAYLPNMEPLDENKKTNSEKDKECLVQHSNFSKDSVDGLTAYFSQIRNTPLLSATEEVHYARLVKKGDKAAIQKMIVSNLRLVVYIAKKFNNKGMPLIDLIQEGNLGLLKAVSKFDPDLESRFSTYAFLWIKQNIQQALMNKSRLIRLPVHIVKLLNKCRKTEYELAKNSAVEPSYEEIAKAINVPVKKVKKLKIVNDMPLSLDLSISTRDTIEINTVMETDGFDPFLNLQKEQQSIDFNQWLGELPGPQAEIITRRFGLLAGKPQTLEEVGLAFNMSREKVRNVQIFALKKLRSMMEKQGLNKEEMLHQY